MTIKLATGVLFIESVLISQAPPPQSPQPEPGKGSEQIGRPDSSGEIIDGGGATLGTASVQEFINSVARENDREIRDAKMVLERTSDREFKTFVQMLIDDRQKLAEDLSGLAMRKNVPLPALSRAAGPAPKKDFDRNTFLEMQIGRHGQQIRAFEEVAKSHADSETRAFAATRIGSVRKHEQEARRILASSKGEKK